MKISRTLSIALLLIAFSQLLVMGNDCNNTDKKCKSPDQSFKISASSRAIRLTKGKKARVVLNVYGGRTYFISLYSKPKVGALQFRIIDPIKKTIFYDNSTEALIDNKTLKFESSQKLFIEIAAPNWKSEKYYECSGIKVAYKK